MLEDDDPEPVVEVEPESASESEPEHLVAAAPAVQSGEVFRQGEDPYVTYGTPSPKVVHPEPSYSAPVPAPEPVYHAPTPEPVVVHHKHEEGILHAHGDLVHTHVGGDQYHKHQIGDPDLRDDGHEKEVKVIKTVVEKVPAYAPPTKVAKVEEPVQKAYAPVVYTPPPAPKPYVAPKEVTITKPKPSYLQEPSWLASWMGGLEKVPAPSLESLTKQYEPVKETRETGTYYSGYSRKWKKPIKPKPEPAPYTPYKPVVAEPKEYVKPTLNYERKQFPRVRPTRRTYERRNRNGYRNYDDDNYLQ